MARPTDPRKHTPDSSHGESSSPSSSSASASPDTMSRTRPMPQMLVEPLGGHGQSDLSPGTDDGVAPTQPTLARPRVVVMEEHPIGLADALARFGYLVRAAATGVEAMSMCAEQAPVAVVVGPGDAERRRVLTAALRVRFGSVLIVYALPPGDIAGVGRPDGVSAILPWPLPSAIEVTRAIPFTIGSPTPLVTRLVPPTAAMAARSVSHAPELSADESAEGSLSSFARPGFPARVPTASLPPVVTNASPPGDEQKNSRSHLAADPDNASTLQVARAQLAGDTREAAADLTMSGSGADHVEADAPTAAAEPGGDVWRQASPLLWRLDEAARFLDELGRRLPVAAEHAETVRAAARLMATLQEQLGDVDRDG